MGKAPSAGVAQVGGVLAARLQAFHEPNFHLIDRNAATRIEIEFIRTIFHLMEMRDQRCESRE